MGSVSGPGRDGVEETGSSTWFKSWLSVLCEKALLEVWGSPETERSKEDSDKCLLLTRKALAFTKHSDKGLALVVVVV